jgi:hypothetical protein
MEQSTTRAHYVFLAPRTRQRKKDTQKGSHVLEVSSKAGTDTTLLRGCVHANEDEVGLFDRAVYVSGEKEIATTCFLDDIDEAGFVNGQGVVGAVPGIDPSLVEVNDGDLDFWALQRNDSAGRAT